LDGGGGRRRPAGGRIDEAFKSADRNGDGKLSSDEFPQPVVFESVDSDKNGFATLDEVQAHFRIRQED
jgi:Ca2+-binding EF-hand superfamily protein